MILMPVVHYSFTAIGLLLISLGVSALLYASETVTNLWLLLALHVAVIGTWTLIYGLGFTESDKGYYGGWGIFLILIAASLAVYAILMNLLYAFSLLAVGLGALILASLMRRHK